MTSFVVPGYVVDSSTTNCPLRRTFAIVRAVDSTYVMSGSRIFVRGVGTAIRIASALASRLGSVVAVKRLPLSIALIVDDGMCSM